MIEENQKIQFENRDCQVFYDRLLNDLSEVK
jgi:hypothetical protein